MATRFSPERLAALLHESGKRREQLAVGVDRSYISIVGYLNGSIVPPSNIIGAIADELGCEIGDLFENDDDTTTAAVR
jgi:hypothetical protein